MTQHLVTIIGKVIPGHGVASGKSGDARFPGGTLTLQAPFFKKLGLDLAPYYSGTLNISIAPKKYALIKPAYTFRNVRWTDTLPPETFSFSPCQVIYNQSYYSGMIYYPHPETKVEHFKNSSILEIIAPFIAELAYGDLIELQLASNILALK